MLEPQESGEGYPSLVPGIDKEILVGASDEWDLTPLYNSDDDPQIEQDLAAATEAANEFADKWSVASEDGALEDPLVLVEALEDYNTWFEQHGPAGWVDYYAELRLAQDAESKTAMEIKARADEVGNENRITMEFLDRAIMRLPEEVRIQLLAAPELKQFWHFLEIYWVHADYLMREVSQREASDQVDASLNERLWIMRQMRSIAIEQLSNQTRPATMEDGQVEERGWSGLLALTKSPVKSVRDQAARQLNEILGSAAWDATQEINSVLAFSELIDGVRGYQRPDSHRHTVNDISTEVVDELLSAVENRFDISRRFYQLKTSLLNQPQLAYHELNVELGEASGQYSIGEALAIVHSAYHKLDPELARIFKSIVENQQLDIYPRQAKIGGAWCYGEDKSPRLPTYILLNFAGRLSDVAIIGHEAGHALHSELTRRKQPAVNFKRALPTLEVASTFMEDFVFRELESEGSDETRLAMMIAKLDKEITPVFRQIAIYRFEQELHQVFRQTGQLSQNDIGKIFQKHMEKYMGESVEQSPGSENWWVQIDQIRTPFYVYTYASGLIISKALQKIIRNDPTSIEMVKDFLSAGMSESPEQLFANMGLDITDPTFWKDGLAEIGELLTQTEDLARQLGKIK